MPHGHAHHCKSKCDYYTTHHTLVLENVEHCGGEPEQAATNGSSLMPKLHQWSGVHFLLRDHSQKFESSNQFAEGIIKRLGTSLPELL